MLRNSDDASSPAPTSAVTRGLSNSSENDFTSMALQNVTDEWVGAAVGSQTLLESLRLRTSDYSAIALQNVTDEWLGGAVGSQVIPVVGAPASADFVATALQNVTDESLGGVRKP